LAHKIFSFEGGLREAWSIRLTYYYLPGGISPLRRRDISFPYEPRDSTLLPYRISEGCEMYLRGSMRNS
jgi:hypothetical protein